MKTLRSERQNIALRLAELSPEDKGHWGSMTVHQMVCHLNDAYKVGLGQKTASQATGVIQRTVMKWAALKVPIKWPPGRRSNKGKGALFRLISVRILLRCSRP
jgi:hypothetical protein